MTGKTHKIGGVAAGLLMCSSMKYLDPIYIAAVVGAAAVGSLIPDLDHKNSTATKATGVVGGLTSSVFTHRGFLHTPLLYAILYFVVLPLIDYPITIIWTGFIVGAFSHLFLDLLNPTGIPIFFPLSSKKVNLCVITTGGIGESVVAVLLVVAAFYLGFVNCARFFM